MGQWRLRRAAEEGPPSKAESQHSNLLDLLPNLSAAQEKQTKKQALLEIV